MAVFRIEKTRDYTVMSNYHLRDRSLSLKAKGLLSLMLSLPEDWDYTMKGLARICKDGIDSISGGIRELETHGYLVRARVRNENGQLGSIEYTILEQPKEPAQTPAPIREKPIRENPIQVKPMLDAPIQENPAQLNTKERNKELCHAWAVIICKWACIPRSCSRSMTFTLLLSTMVWTAPRVIMSSLLFGTSSMSGMRRTPARRSVP